MQSNTFLVETSDKVRLDKYLVLCTDLSRSHIHALIKSGYIAVNESQTKKPGHLLVTDDTITLRIPDVEKNTMTPSHEAHYTVIYEDKHTLLINKEKGLVVHPGSNNTKHTLVHELLGRPDPDFVIKHVERPGIVHRLDKDTSGILLIAKNDQALLYYSALFATRDITKTYLCIAHNIPETDHAIIEAPIARAPRDRKRMDIRPGGKYAKSEYTLLGSAYNMSLLEVTLHTGRTHQIRVHLKSVGLPIVGDPLYGKNDTYETQFLHAYTLEFIPFGEKTLKRFVAKPPEDMYNLAQEIGLSHLLPPA